MTSAIAYRSLQKALPGKNIRMLDQQRLIFGSSSSERVETNGLASEVHLAANQTMGPERIDMERTSEQAHRAFFAGTAKENNQTLGMGLKILIPRDGKGTSLRRSLDALRGPLAMRVEHPAFDGPLEEREGHRLHHDAVRFWEREVWKLVNAIGRDLSM